MGLKPDLAPRTMSPASLANLIPIKPGEIRNPAGRPSAGRSVKEKMNDLALKNMTEDELRAISKNKKKGWTERAAAERMLRCLESPDIADFEPVLDGQSSLREMRAEGFDTSAIKKVKVKKRSVPQEKGPPIEETERDIELHNRGGSELDRIMDRTEGKPMQEITGIDGGPLEVVVKIVRGVTTDDI